MISLTGDFKMEIWEKKLRGAIRTEIRGLVNEGKLDIAALAENMQLDVSELLAEADVVVTIGDARVEVNDVAGQAGGIPQVDVVDVVDDEEVEEVEEVEDESVMSEARWMRLAGLIKG